MQEDYALSLEEIKRMMANAMGTNLAGQSMAGPVATGQAYAQQIAGGMPREQVIEPGVSYSPEMAGGYTQKDLDMIAAGPAPVMPIPPTTDEVATIEDQMPYAPPGVQEPTPYIPGQTPFPGIPDFLRDLDFSFLENLDFSNLPGAQEPSEPQFGSSAPPGFIPPSSGSFNTMAFVDYYNPTTGETWSAPSGGWTAPEGWIVGRPDGGLKFTFDEPTPIGDIRDTYTPEQVAELERKEIERQAREEANIINKYGSRENLQNQIDAALFTNPVIPQVPVQAPMNFTGLPQMPVLTPGMTVDRTSPLSPKQSIFAPQTPKQPKIPAIPNLPMNFTSLPQTPVMPQIAYTPPVPSFVQPQIEDIVSPIRAGSLRNFQQPGLFSF